MKLEKNRLKREKKYKLTRLTHQTCDMDHTRITL